MHSTNQYPNSNMTVNDSNRYMRYPQRQLERTQADRIATRDYSPKHLERPIASIKMSDLPSVGNVAVAYANSTAQHMKTVTKAIARIPKPAQVIMTLLAAASLTVPLLGSMPAQAAEANTMAGKATDTVAKKLSDDVVKSAKDGIDGYMTDLNAHRNQADGRADAIAAAYKGYIDDATVEELHTYESYAKAASSNGEADEWVNKINDKENAAKSAKDAAEQKAAAEAAEKVQQEAAAKQAAVTAATQATTSQSSNSSSSSSSSGASTSGGFMSVSQFKSRGAMNWNGHRWTYYSETVLPGTALNIPGRHVSNGAVCDSDGYVVLASRDYAKGTVIDTPIGKGRVYDYCPTSGTIDLYVH